MAITRVKSTSLRMQMLGCRLGNAGIDEFVDKAFVKPGDKFHWSCGRLKS